ncbi:MAG: hypothetical protein HYX34_08620 [Actinobacteria bacterium]|nr:hypothetical protein [Actinomycetota bacterium]
MPPRKLRGSPQARRVRTPWRGAAVLVCQECEGAGTLSPADVAGSIDDRLAPQVDRRVVRVIRTQCLDICPKEAVSVAVVGSGRDVTVVISGPDGCRAVAEEVADTVAEEMADRVADHRAGPGSAGPEGGIGTGGMGRTA